MPTSLNDFNSFSLSISIFTKIFLNVASHVLLWTQWTSWAVGWYLLSVVSWQTTLKFSGLKWWLLYKLCFCALINYSWTFFWRSYLRFLMSLQTDDGRLWSNLDARMLHPSWDIQNGTSTCIYYDWLGASLCNCFLFVFYYSALSSRASF